MHKREGEGEIVIKGSKKGRERLLILFCWAGCEYEACLNNKGKAVLFQVSGEEYNKKDLL